MRQGTMDRASKSCFTVAALAALSFVGIAHQANAQISRNDQIEVREIMAGKKAKHVPKPPIQPAVVNNFLLTAGNPVSWSLASNWDTNIIPNGVDVQVAFPSLTGAELVNIDGGAPKTIGSFTLTNDSTNPFDLRNGAVGSALIFQVSSGSASLTINGTGNVVNTFGSSGTNLTVTLNSTLDITVNNTATAVSAGALSVTSAISGTGGIIKDGDGRVSFATATKPYTGSTIVNAGSLRVSVAGEPTATSSVTVNSGGALVLGTTSSGTWQFGTGPSTLITLNGVGNAGTTGALQSNAGSGTGTLVNNVNLASNSTITTATALQLNGTVSGPGALTKNGSGTAAQNTLTLNVANSYMGGTNIDAGTLVATADGALGSGNVSLTASGVTLTLQAGATNNYISNNATISIVTGAVANLNFSLGQTDAVGGIVLNGVAQTTPGTYGSTSSMADFQSAFFLGTGTLTLVPEPSTWVMTIMGAGLLMSVQRFRRKKS